MSLWQGHRLRLRAVEVDDWKTFYEWDKDSEGGRLMDYVWFPSSQESVRRWTEEEATSEARGDRFRFQMEALDGGALVGTVNTHSTEPRDGTFSYGLAVLPAHQRKGYAREAIALVLRHFFHELRYQKVNVTVYAYNAPSIALHERMGFALEGRLRRHKYSGGAYHDVLLYGMTREEFDATLLPALPPG